MTHQVIQMKDVGNKGILFQNWLQVALWILWESYDIQLKKRKEPRKKLNNKYSESWLRLWGLDSMKELVYEWRKAGRNGKRLGKLKGKKKMILEGNGDDCTSEESFNEIDLSAMLKVDLGRKIIKYL